MSSRRVQGPWRRRRLLLAAGGAALIGASLWTSRAFPAIADVGGHGGKATATPVKHLVVIFQENVSFDHYFGTYPNAANTDGQSFTGSGDTPAVNGLLPATVASIPPSQRHGTDLLASNPNVSPPQRLDSTPTGTAGSPGQLTCDQDHNYSDEQQAVDNGKADRYVQSVGTDGGSKSPFGTPCNSSIVMDYYDGNTVTALWNYAQQYAMSDNSFNTTYGPSSPGAISLISGNTGAVDMTHAVNNPSVATPTKPNADLTPDGKGGYSLTSDAQPYWDDCSTRDAVGLQGRNIGDSLNAAGLSWGWFEGGQRPTTTYAQGLAAMGHTGQSTSTFLPDEFKTAGFQNGVPHSSNQGLCDAVHPIGVAVGGTGQWGYKDDYIPHHEPFNYYASTANPHHITLATDSIGNVTPSALKTIGTDTQSYVGGVPQFDTPNHNYDGSDFDQLVAAITRGDLPSSALPAVSFLKAPGYQDGHAAYSDPADEQAFVTKEVNALMQSRAWSSTAIVVDYDDSDGWYDHVVPPILNPSLSLADNLTNTTTTGPTSGQCGPNPQAAAPLDGEQGRCGFGPRVPLLVISAFARHDHVDHNVSDNASAINFVEYNWRLPGLDASADQLLATTNRSERIPFDLAGMFDFGGEDRNDRLLLDGGTGQPVER